MKDRWLDGLTPEDLPEGDLRLVAELCGVDVAVSLAEHMGGVQLYVPSAAGLISRKKHEYIVRHFDGSNCKELAVATGYSERWVYEILARRKGRKQPAVFEK
jgi:Mor family transcriptional regulator